MISKVSTIGIDIDGTLSDTIGALLVVVTERYGDIMNFSQWKTWNPHQIPELQAQGILKIEDTINLFSSILQDNGVQSIDPIKDSIKGIQIFQSLGKELIALSGRMEETRKYTTGWLEKYYSGAFQEILLTNYDTPRQVAKYELARKYDIGLMIEDNAHYAIDLSIHGIATILLEAPWNIDIDTSKYSNIYRVKNWFEILELLK